MGEGQAQARGTAGAGDRGILRCGVVALLAWLVGASPAVAEPCSVWPGEPDPLPRLSDRDALRARWAALRVTELVALAEAFEAQERPGRAHLMWSRVQCIDPTNTKAAAAVGRLPLVEVHEPVVERRAAEADPDARAFEGLASVIPVPRVPLSPAALARRTLRRSLAEASGHVKAARFEDALASAARGREALGTLGATADVNQRAEIETLAATAALALGRDAEARASFVRALEAKPDLSLDPALTPPKVRRALEAARGSR